jgi:hypothetical protein
VSVWSDTNGYYGRDIGEKIMSQAKVDRYKKEKANRKKTLKREKAGRMAGRICAWAILVVIVGWAGYSGYQYYEDNRPVKTFYTDVSAVSDYLNGLSTEE